MDFATELKIVFPQQDFGWEGGNQYLRSVRFAARELQESGLLEILEGPKKLSYLGNKISLFAERFAPGLFKIDSGLNFPWPLSGLENRSMHWIPDCQDIEMPEMFMSDEIRRRDESRTVAIKRNRAIFFSSQTARNVFVKAYGEIGNLAGVIRFTSMPAYEQAPGASNLELECRDCETHGYFYLPNQWWKHKNHVYAIEEFMEYRNQGGRRHLIMTGEAKDYRWPSYISELTKLVSSRDFIHYLGLVDRPHQQNLYRECVAVIQPSLYEGWSTSIEEALYFGAPIIGSNLPVLREQLAGTHEFRLVEVREKGELLSALLLPPMRDSSVDLKARHGLRWQRFKNDMLKTLNVGFKITTKNSPQESNLL
jgi:glycosyltransferase involved in cell wall biosynthesis